LKEVIDKFKQNLSDLQKSIIDTYVAQNKLDPKLGLDDLITIMASKKEALRKTISVVRMKQIDGEVITARNINEAMAALFNDVFMLFGSSSLVSETLYKYQRNSEEKFNRLESLVKTQESRLRTLGFVNDHKEHLEAFLVDMQDNNADIGKGAVYNPYNNSVSSNVLSSEEAEKNHEMRIYRLGNPDIKTLPNYQVNRVFDRSKLTAWYEIVAYKSRPNFVIAPAQDQTLVTPQSIIESKTNSGTTVVSTNANLYTLGDYISIGEVNSMTHETVRVNGVDLENSTITVGALKNTHYINEPIYKGRNLKQTYGAVSVIEIEFPFPQKINFIRLSPFSSKPVKIHGIYVESGDINEPWRMIEGTEISRLDKGVGSMKTNLTYVYLN